MAEEAMQWRVNAKTKQTKGAPALLYRPKTFFEKAQITRHGGDFSAPAKLLLHHCTVAAPLAYAWSSPCKAKPLVKLAISKTKHKLARRTGDLQVARIRHHHWRFPCHVASPSKLAIDNGGLLYNPCKVRRKQPPCNIFEKDPIWGNIL